MELGLFEKGLARRYGHGQSEVIAMDGRAARAIAKCLRQTQIALATMTNDIDRAKEGSDPAFSK